MPRPETPLSGSGPRVELARALRALRDAAGGPTYRRLGDELAYSSTVLSRAASTAGRCPTWEVVQLLTERLGGDLATMRVLWAAARDEEQLWSAQASGDLSWSPPSTPDSVPSPRPTPNTPNTRPKPDSPRTPPPTPAVPFPAAVPKPTSPKSPPRPTPTSEPEPVAVDRAPAETVRATATRASARLTQRGLFLASLIVFLATIAFAVFPRLPEGFRSVFSPVPVTAQITSPAEIQVPRRVELFGTYSGHLHGQLVWAVTQDLATNLFYPAEKPCAIVSDSKFDCGDILLPGTPGSPVRLLVVAAGPEQSNDFAQYFVYRQTAYPGLTALPDGIINLGSADRVVEAPPR